MLAQKNHDQAVICPSILSADFAQLKSSIESLDRTFDWLHCDVMDGHFVPNISFAFPVIEGIRKHFDQPFDVHMMVDQPELWVDRLAASGADSLVFHQEATCHGHRLTQQIRDAGCSPGVAICPATPVWVLEEYLPYVDLILLMTVNPGFGGQAYIKSMEEKISRVRQMIDESGYPIYLQVDGGISDQTIAGAARAGADCFVAGSAIFADQDPAGSCRKLRSLADQALASRP